MNNTALELAAMGGTYNVLNTAYAGGADPTGVADSTAAINAALTAAPLGGWVYLPPGVYKTTAPLYIPPQVTLTGYWHSSHIDSSASCIQPASGFTGAAVILIVDQTTGGYDVASNQQGLFFLTLDGTNLTGDTIDGIQAQGFVHGVILQDVQIRNMPAHGLLPVANSSGVPYSWRGTRLVADTCGSHGFSVFITDCTWIDCESINCTGNGFYLDQSPSNSHFLGCRAEYCLNGMALTGAWAETGTPGGVMVTDFSTDANVQNGVLVTATGSAPASFSNLMLRRDGANGGSAGGGYAGFHVSGSTIPVSVDGITVYPGLAQSDYANSPEYGFAATSSAANVSINGGGVLHAATTAWHDDGSNTGIYRGPNLIDRVGSTNSFTSSFNGLQSSYTDVTFTNPTTGAVTDLLSVSGLWQPQDTSYLAWTYDPMLATTSGAPANNTITLARVNVRASLSCTNVSLWVATAGSGLTSSENYSGLYASSGTLIATTADQSTNWASAGLKTMALSGGPYALTAGYYWVAILPNASTVPAFTRASASGLASSGAAFMNVGLTVSAARWATNTTGTTLPATITVGSNNFLNAPYWTALS